MSVSEVRAMSDMDVRIVGLPRMRVVSFKAESESPEADASAQLMAWCESRGLLDDLEQHPIFGFNNPDPSPGQKEYGYEFWVRVDPDAEVEGGVEAKEFGGGLYAVTPCRLKDEIASEFFKKHGSLESWSRLHEWVEGSKYRSGKHRWLEKPRDPRAAMNDLVLDLYYPIER
jgi:DNA gyrase inhibitor GyrI